MAYLIWPEAGLTHTHSSECSIKITKLGSEATIQKKRQQQHRIDTIFDR